MNYEAAGVSKLYYDIELEAERRHDEAWARLGKADHPVVSGNQCFFCKRGIQEGEGIVRDGENVAHAACVRFLVGLINAADRPRAYVPEPNMEAVRQDVEESERKLGATKKAIELNQLLSRYTKNRLMYK